MHFAFTAQQLEFRDAVRQVLARECAPADLREAFDHPAARTARWTTLAELGVVGLTVPEACGGLGLGLVDLVPLLEEAGRVSLPEPLVETTALAATLLTDAVAAGRAPDRARDWLAGIASGDLTAAVASSPDPAIPVAGADGADLFVLVAFGPSGPELHVLTPESVVVTPVPSLDPTRRLGTVDWTPGADSLVTGGGPVIGRGADLAAVATSAVLVGLADRMITLAAEYAGARRQFGKPIGSFQAVKHLLAGARVTLEFARPLTYAAAWSFDEGEPNGSRTASAAKAYASDAATEAARVALQVHGAIGYTWECDLHLYLKRAWALAEAWGSAAEHRARLLDLLVRH